MTRNNALVCNKVIHMAGDERCQEYISRQQKYNLHMLQVMNVYLVICPSQTEIHTQNYLPSLSSILNDLSILRHDYSLWDFWQTSTTMFPTSLAHEVTLSICRWSCGSKTWCHGRKNLNNYWLQFHHDQMNCQKNLFWALHYKKFVVSLRCIVNLGDHACL